jgi:hypothetical protein
MTDNSSITDCMGTFSSEGSSDPFCGCSDAKKPWRAMAAKYGAGIIALCAICCAVPPLLIALGLMGITSAAYFSAGLQVALIVSVMLGLGYLWIRYVKKNR